MAVVVDCCCQTLFVLLLYADLHIISLEDVGVEHALVLAIMNGQQNPYVTILYDNNI